MGSVGLSDRNVPSTAQLSKYQCLIPPFVDIVPDAISAKMEDLPNQDNLQARNWPYQTRVCPIPHYWRQANPRFCAIPSYRDQFLFLEIRRSELGRMLFRPERRRKACGYDSAA